MVPAISASTSSRREMLQAMTWASPPALTMPSATSLQASALREEITTLAPSLASSSAEERPMPRLEPVMTATWPVRANGSRECAPDDRLREAIQTSFVTLDCFVASLLAMTVEWLNQPARPGDAAQMVV